MKRTRVHAPAIEFEKESMGVNRYIKILSTAQQDLEFGQGEKTNAITTI